MHRLPVRALAGAVASVAILAGPLGDTARAAPADQSDAVQVFNRDVYEIVGSTLRNPDADTDPDAQLFNVAGVGLETSPGHFLTWGEWQAASAASRARTVGGPSNPRTVFDIDLTGLVPGGLYSVFWGTLGPDSEQPLCPGVERTLPLDRVGGGSGLDPNSFVADAGGAATYRGRAEGALLDATQVFLSIVYRFYPGQSPYPFPNLGEFLTQGENCRSSFGEDTMRQLIVFQKF